MGRRGSGEGYQGHRESGEEKAAGARCGETQLPQCRFKRGNSLAGEAIRDRDPATASCINLGSRDGRTSMDFVAHVSPFAAVNKHHNREIARGQRRDRGPEKPGRSCSSR